MLITNVPRENMLMQRDFDLNSAHRYTDSLKEAFRHTMMKQEVIFRNQVNELHRLYRVQITLMKDLGCKEFDRYTSWKNSTKLPLKETTISSILTAGTMQPRSQELLEHGGMYYKIQQRLFDHQLPADMHIRHADKDFSNKENVSGHLKDTMESHVGNISDAVDLTLSLSLGEDNKRREGAKKTWFDRKTLSCPQVVINLEDSTGRVCSGHLDHGPSLGFTTSITHSVTKHQLDVSILSDTTMPSNMKEDISHEIAESSSLVDDSECCLEQHSLGQEFKESQNDYPCDYLPAKKPKQVTSYEGTHMDLNQVHHDDSSCHSNDITVVHPSTASSSGGFREKVSKETEGCCPTTICRKEINDWSNETSDMLQQDDTVNIALANSIGKTKRTKIWHCNSKLIGINETKVSHIDLESLSELPADLCEDHHSCGSDCKTEKNKCTTEPQGEPLNDLNHTCIDTRKVACEKSEVEDSAYLCSDQSQDSSKDKHGSKSSTSWKSCSDNVSSNRKIIQSGVEAASSSVPAFDQISGIHEQSQVAILSGGQNQRFSESSESNREHLNEKQESDKVDALIQRAAESLIQISLLNFACSQDCSTRSGSSGMEVANNEQPQNSCDSFELISLKLTGSNPDDYSVSSKPFEINDVGEKDVTIKLRRGSRMKDFQRDILPVLGSLSRHEIYEDISILDGVLRSKEYRKNRARMADGESWCPPSRSRRTRLNYIRRRKFS